MSENEPSGRSSGENEALRQIAAELKLFNDRFKPVPWYKLDLGRPIGYGLVGLLFLVFGAIAGDDTKGFLLIAGAIFFVAQSIAGNRITK